MNPKRKKNKSDKIISWLDTGIFPATIMFSCGFTYDELIFHLKKKKANDWLVGLEGEKILIDSASDLALHSTIKKGKGEKSLFYIYIKDQFTFTDWEYCKLAHEVLHICQFFLPQCLNRNKEFEAEAYLHSHIMMQCLKELRGKKI